MGSFLGGPFYGFYESLMNAPFTILVGVAGVLAIINLVKPAWPILGVSVLLICVALYLIAPK